MAKKKVFAKIFGNAHGQFAAKAKRAGMTTQTFAQKNMHAPGTLGRQARAAMLGMRFGKH